VINVYSIKEILEASDNILKFSSISKDRPILDDKPIELNKMNTMNIENPTVSNKSKINKKSIPKDIEKIIQQAEISQLKEKKLTVGSIKNITDQNLLVENQVTQKELIDDLYKTFGKKIKKNSLKLILELRSDIILLTKNITTLKNDKKQIEQKNNELNNNIVNLKFLEENLENNLKQSINGFNLLQSENKNLKLNYYTLDENFLDTQKKLTVSNENNKQLEDINKNLNHKLIEHEDNKLILSSKVKKLENQIFIDNNSLDELAAQNKALEKKNTELKTKLSTIGHIDDYLHEINELKLKNKDLVNTIEKLKSYENTNDKNLDIIKELENKINYYQEENVRISGVFHESNKKFEITKKSLNELQKHKSGLIEKINSINEVIQNENIVTSAFGNDLENNKIEVIDSSKPMKNDKIDLDEEIKKIFTKN